MKISVAQEIYQENRSILVEQKRMLSKQRDEMVQKYEATGDSLFSEEAATLQLSLEATEKAFLENQKVLDSLALQHAAIANSVTAKQQQEAAEQYAADMGKIMTVFRRLAKGDIVPSSDEKRLLEYDSKMYQMAKNMQAMAQQMEKERKKHKSLWEDEEEMTEYDPEGTADNAEYSGDLPNIEIPSTEASADGGELS